jgi:hypothetical protein
MSVLYITLRNDQQDTISVKNQTEDAKKEALQARELVAAIQQSRLDFIRIRCIEQNKRHDNTIKELNNIISNLPPGERLDIARQNKPGTVLLINALAPIRDCDKVVQKARIQP